MNIYAKLAQIQIELKAPKAQRNTFGKYNYRSCEDILEAVKPLLKKHGLTIMLGDTIVNVGDRYYIKATATLIDDTEKVETTAYAREDEDLKGMTQSQITGAASSYARKYALNGLFAIDDTKDADALNDGTMKKELICEMCGQPIKDHKGYTAEQIADKGVKDYGLKICHNCYNKKWVEQKRQADEGGIYNG